VSSLGVAVLLVQTSVPVGAVAAAARAHQCILNSSRCTVTQRAPLAEPGRAWPTTVSHRRLTATVSRTLTTLGDRLGNGEPGQNKALCEIILFFISSKEVMFHLCLSVCLLTR